MDSVSCPITTCGLTTSNCTGDRQLAALFEWPTPSCKVTSMNEYRFTRKLEDIVSVGTPGHSRLTRRAEAFERLLAVRGR